MEVWQAVSMLGLWRIEDVNIAPMAQDGPVRGRRVSDTTLIKARLAAAQRGEHAPFELIGVPTEVVMGASDG